MCRDRCPGKVAEPRPISYLICMRIEEDMQESLYCVMEIQTQRIHNAYRR